MGLLCWDFGSRPSPSQTPHSQLDLTVIRLYLSYPCPSRTLSLVALLLFHPGLFYLYLSTKFSSHNGRSRSQTPSLSQGYVTAPNPVLELIPNHTGRIAGSMSDVPQNLLEHIKHFEEIFTVDTATLKKIVDHFVNELTKGKWFRF